MTPKKILVISPGFPLDEQDTYTIPYLSHLLPELAERHPDISITVVAVHKPFTRRHYNWRGIDVIALGGNNIKFPAKALFLCKAFLTIRKELAAGGYCGVLNLWHNEFSIMARWLHPNHFTYLLGQDVLRENWYLKWFRPEPERLIAVSEHANRILEQSAGLRAGHVIPIAASEKLFPEFNMRQRPIDIFGAGWLTELKNFRLFAEIILALRNINPNIKAEIAGDGPQRQQLQDFIDDNDLRENLFLCGLLTHSQTLAKMNQSKIFLHTSTFEAGATVYAEALFAGCRVVGTVPVLDEGTRGFWHVRDRDEAVERISILIKDEFEAVRIESFNIADSCRKIHALFTSN